MRKVAYSVLRFRESEADAVAHGGGQRIAAPFRESYSPQDQGKIFSMLCTLPVGYRRTRFSVDGTARFEPPTIELCVQKRKTSPEENEWSLLWGKASTEVKPSTSQEHTTNPRGILASNTALALMLDHCQHTHTHMQITIHWQGTCCSRGSACFCSKFRLPSDALASR